MIEGQLLIGPSMRVGDRLANQGDPHKRNDAKVKFSCQQLGSADR